MVEGDHGAADHGDVHHVPVVPHVGPGVQDKPAVQDLWQRNFTYTMDFISKQLSVKDLKTVPTFPDSKTDGDEEHYPRNWHDKYI